MRYFSKFPALEYDFSIGIEKPYPVVITDTMVRLRAIVDQEYDLSKIVIDYLIIDGDRLENISHKLYGKSEYHWTIPFINEKYNYVVDYPMSTSELDEYCKQKYGVSKVDDVHHYEDYDGNVITGYYDYFTDKWMSNRFLYNGVSTMGAAVSNKDYESALNANKRKIKVISPLYIGDFVSKFTEKMISIKEGVSV